jgi:hypothetical protein
MSMDMPTNGEKERHPIEKVTLNSEKIKGLEDFAVDEEGEMVIKFRVLKPMGHGSTWDKEDLKKPMEGEFEIISGKASSTMKKIDDAETLDDLEKIKKEIK